MIINKTLLVQFTNVVAFTLSYSCELLHQHTFNRVPIPTTPVHPIPLAGWLVYTLVSFVPESPFFSHHRRSQYREFASYNDYVLVHLLLQHSCSAVFVWQCSGCTSVSAHESSKHMFLRRFKVLLNATAASGSSVALSPKKEKCFSPSLQRLENENQNKKPNAHFTHVLGSAVSLSQTNPGSGEAHQVV